MITSSIEIFDFPLGHRLVLKKGFMIGVVFYNLCVLDNLFSKHFILHSLYLYNIHFVIYFR